MKTIAIIDDDIHIGDMLAEVLAKNGYRTVRAYSGTEALYLLERERPDLVLLDLMLPGLSGEEVLPQIKGAPVIVVSAKIGIDDKVSLLTGGAVDYVTKPFNIKELLARIAVHLRTAEAFFSKDVHSDNGEKAGCSGESLLQFDNLLLNEQSHMVTAAGCPVKLTKTVFAILKLLMRNPGQAIAKSVILDRISCDTPDCTETSLKIHVSNLRRKLREAGGKDYIEAVWGIGFKMAQNLCETKAEK